jgi:hypothetical protein
MTIAYILIANPHPLKGVKDLQQNKMQRDDD